MTRQIKKYWEEASEDYQLTCGIPIGIHYGNGAPFEDEIKLLGSLRKKKILEIGCGGAQCGIAMAKQGADVTGIDISENQLNYAKALAKENGVEILFHQGDIRRLTEIKSNNYDLVFSAWALLYVDNLRSCFQEVYRVLKRGGSFVASLPHPFFRTVSPKTMKLRESYFDVGKKEIAETWNDGSNHKNVVYDHTVSELINMLLDTDFFIERIIEPDSRKKYKKDPWYNKFEVTAELAKYIPQTLILKSRK